MRDDLMDLNCQLPVRYASVIDGCGAQNLMPAHLVGEMMIAPISLGPSGVSRRVSLSRIGITKAKVLPEPVTAFR